MSERRLGLSLKPAEGWYVIKFAGTIAITLTGFKNSGRNKAFI